MLTSELRNYLVEQWNEENRKGGKKMTLAEAIARLENCEQRIEHKGESK